MLALLCRHGRLGMSHPSSRGSTQCGSSRNITAPLTNGIAEQDLALGAAVSDVLSCTNAITLLSATCLPLSTSVDGELQHACFGMS